jgi:hypothetical protein
MGHGLFKTYIPSPGQFRPGLFTAQFKVDHIQYTGIKLTEYENQFRISKWQQFENYIKIEIDRQPTGDQQNW